MQENNGVNTCTNQEYRDACANEPDDANGDPPQLPCLSHVDNVTCDGTFTCAQRSFIQPCNWQQFPALLGSQGLTISGPMDTELPYPCAIGLVGSAEVEGQS